MARHARPPHTTGRHRLGSPQLVHCRSLAAVDSRLRRRSWRMSFRPAGRHTWTWLARTGGHPKTAFALILSL